MMRFSKNIPDVYKMSLVKPRPATCLNFESRYPSLYRFKTPEEVADFFYQTMGSLYGLPEIPPPKLKPYPCIATRKQRKEIKAHNKWVLQDWLNERKWWRNFGDPDPN